ncbi:MAG: PilZ domain-containing protein [Deltaproteobacteria bacterium]|nr:PilZ domain-containing protein [Deltaproteobacteria bacterium]
MHISEQREEYRMPLRLFLNEHIGERVQRSMTLNLSTSGIFLNRLQLPPKQFSTSLTYPHHKSIVGLEFELPETSEVIWAAGRVCFDQANDYFFGTGLRFEGIADMHRRLIRDVIMEYREKRLRQLLSTVRRNRITAAPTLN